MSPRDEVRLRDILDAIGSVTSFVRARSRSDLERDQMLLFALAHAIQIIGEAAARLAPESRAELPAVPWNDIIAMRNRLVHAYADMDASILWKTATEALPPLEAQIRQYLEREA